MIYPDMMLFDEKIHSLKNLELSIETVPVLYC